MKEHGKTGVPNLQNFQTHMDRLLGPEAHKTDWFPHLNLQRHGDETDSGRLRNWFCERYGKGKIWTISPDYVDVCMGQTIDLVQGSKTWPDCRWSLGIPCWWFTLRQVRLWHLRFFVIGRAPKDPQHKWSGWTAFARNCTEIIWNCTSSRNCNIDDVA